MLLQVWSQRPDFGDRRDAKITRSILHVDFNFDLRVSYSLNQRYRPRNFIEKLHFSYPSVLTSICVLDSGES